MRFISSISFSCLLILFLELVALPFFINASAKQDRTISKAETCCAKKSAGGGCAKSSDEGTEGPECCVNCPLTYVMITPQFNMPAKTTAAVKRMYATYQTNYLFTYCTSAWKPPNAA